MNGEEIEVAIFVEEEPTVKELGNFLQLVGVLNTVIEQRYDFSEISSREDLNEFYSLPAQIYRINLLVREPERFGEEVELNHYESQFMERDFGYLPYFAELMSSGNSYIISDMAFSGILNNLRTDWDHYAYEESEYEIEIDNITSGSPILLEATAGLALVLGTTLLMNFENEDGDRTVFLEGRKIIQRVRDLPSAIRRGRNITGQGPSTQSESD